MFDNMGQQIESALVANDRWTLYLNGLLVTLAITGIAVVLGLVIGSLVAIAKVNALYSKRWKWVAALCEVYTTVIRGTPVVVQLLIMYFIIFAWVPPNAAILVASLAFGINSGAYVSEIVRAGIMSIDRGQMEAGRSLGLSRGMTMRSIIFPQAIKNILPALGNEIITLFKETSVVGFIAVQDLTRAAEMVRTRTLQPVVPLFFIAFVYLGCVMLISWGLRKLEKSWRKEDRCSYDRNTESDQGIQRKSRSQGNFRDDKSG